LINPFEDKSFPTLTIEYRLNDASSEIDKIAPGEVLGFREAGKPTRSIFEDHLDRALKSIDDATTRINDRVTSVPKAQTEGFRHASRHSRSLLKTAKRELRLAGMTGIQLFLNSKLSIISLLVAAFAAAIIYFVAV